MSQPEGIDTPIVGVFVAIGALLVAVIVYLSQAMYYSIDSEIEHANQVEAAQAYAAPILAAQQASVMEYKWKNKEAGRVQIPIDQAMVRVLHEEVASQQQAKNVSASDNQEAVHTSK